MAHFLDPRSATVLWKYVRFCIPYLSWLHAKPIMFDVVCVGLELVADPAQSL